MSARREQPRLVVAVGAVVAYALAAAVLVALAVEGPADGIFLNDVLGRFWDVARLDAPWVEEAVEFPPIAVAVLEPLAWVSLSSSPATHLGVQTLVLITIVAVLWWGEGWRPVQRWMLWSLPLLPLALLRVDLPSVLACVVALVLVRRDRDRAAGVAIAIGVLAKLWPGALVIGLWRHHRDAVVVAVLTSAASVAVWMLLTVPDAPIQVIGFRDAQGWHAESVVGAVVRLVDGGTPALESGAWRFGDASVVPTLVLGLLAVLLAVLVAARVDDLRRDEAWALAGVVVGSIAVTWWLAEVIDGTVWGWSVLLVRNASVVASAALLVRTGLTARQLRTVERSSHARAARG